jgi:hypothetical protein
VPVLHLRRLALLHRRRLRLCAHLQQVGYVLRIQMQVSASYLQLLEMNKKPAS